MKATVSSSPPKLKFEWHQDLQMRHMPYTCDGRPGSQEELYDAELQKECLKLRETRLQGDSGQPNPRVWREDGVWHEDMPSAAEELECSREVVLDFLSFEDAERPLSHRQAGCVPPSLHTLSSGSDSSAGTSVLQNGPGRPNYNTRNHSTSLTQARSDPGDILEWAHEPLLILFRACQHEDPHICALLDEPCARTDPSFSHPAGEARRSRTQLRGEPPSRRCYSPTTSPIVPRGKRSGSRSSPSQPVLPPPPLLYRFTRPILNPRRYEDDGNGNCEKENAGGERRSWHPTTGRGVPSFLVIPKRSRRRPDLQGPCTYCHAPESPQWRKGPPAAPVLCNACGTRFLRTNTLRKSQKKPPPKVGGSYGRRRPIAETSE